MSSEALDTPSLLTPLRPCSFDKELMKAKLVSKVEYLEKAITMSDDGLQVYQLSTYGTGAILKISCAENMFIVKAYYIGVYPLLKNNIDQDDQIRFYEELLRISRMGIRFELPPNNIISAVIEVPVTAEKGEYDAYDLAVTAVLYLLGVLGWFNYILKQGSVEEAEALTSLLAVYGAREGSGKLMDSVLEG